MNKQMRSPSLAGTNPVCPMLEKVAASSDFGKLALIDEQGMFVAVWSRLSQLYPPATTSIALYGAGKFAKRFLSSASDDGNTPNIIAVLDDIAKPGDSIHGIPVVNPASQNTDSLSAIVLATDALEETLEQRCLEVFGDTVPIHKISSILKAVQPAKFVESLPHSRNEIELSISFRRPERLNCVIVCSGYGDYLSWTLPHNITNFDRFVVVTSKDDLTTQQLAHDSGAILVVSDAYKAKGASFNKGRMLNEGLRALHDQDAWTLITDADILVSHGFRERINSRCLHPECLYYAVRLNAPSSNTEAWLEAYLQNRYDCNQLRFERPGANRMPWGYFQLIHPNASAIYGRYPHVYPTSFNTAGDVDYAFMECWTPERRILLPESVIHITHGKEGTNWPGRQSARLLPNKALDT